MVYWWECCYQHIVNKIQSVYPQISYWISNKNQIIQNLNVETCMFFSHFILFLKMCRVEMCCIIVFYWLKVKRHFFYCVKQHFLSNVHLSINEQNSDSSDKTTQSRKMTVNSSLQQILALNQRVITQDTENSNVI